MKNYIFLAALLCVSSSANSALISYDSYSAWSSNPGMVSDEDFSGVTSNLALDVSPTVIGQLTLSAHTSGTYSNAQIKVGYSSSTLDINGFLNGDYVEVTLAQPVAGIGFYYLPGDATDDPLNIYINGMPIASLYNSLLGSPRFFGVYNDESASINSISFVSSNNGMYTEIESISWLATPVPLPAAAWLLSSGIIFLMTCIRKSK